MVNSFKVHIKISELLGKRKLKIQDLANLTGLSYDTTRALYHETFNDLMLSTLVQVYKALKLSSWDDLLEYIPEEETE